MALTDFLEQIYRLPKSAAGARSLSNMEKFCAFFGHPERSFPTVHVAGTNGKGSVCTKMATALQTQGYRTGLYTSPHISSFSERIQVDGVQIPEEAIERLSYPVMRAISACGVNPAFFEIATLLAFLYFQERGVEIAVIETGLGGMYDATNVVSPLVSVITSVGYDHQEILGPTLQDICRAKAGILKPSTPVVIGKTVPAEWVKPTADEKGCRLVQCNLSFPSYDAENRETARLALEAVSGRFPIGGAALAAGLEAKPPCRFERRKWRGREVVLDVAHNPQGFERLLEELSHSYPNRTFRFVCGFSKAKDVSGCAKAIRGTPVHLVGGSHPRLASPEELAPYFDSPILEATVATGIQNACLAAENGDILVVAGSFFIMEESHFFLSN